MIIITLIESSYYLKMMTYRRHCKMKMHIRIQSTALWIWWQCSVHGHKTTSIPHSYILLEKPTPGWVRHPSWGTVSPYNKYGGDRESKSQGFLKIPGILCGDYLIFGSSRWTPGEGEYSEFPGPGLAPPGWGTFFSSGIWHLYPQPFNIFLSRGRRKRRLHLLF